MRNGYRLTEGQHRHLKVALSRLVLEARQLASELEQEGEAARVRSSLDQIRADAQRLASELGMELQEPERDWRRRVRAWASVWWADVLDCGPDRLRGYGTVDPELIPMLAPRIEELAGRLLRLSHEAEASSEP